MIEEEQTKIISSSSAKFEKNLYIERQLEFPLANFNHFYDQLAKNMGCTTDKLHYEFVVDSQGNIEWFEKDDQEKEKIWEEMKKIVNENSRNSPSSNDDPIKKNLRTNDDATPRRT